MAIEYKNGIPDAPLESEDAGSGVKRPLVGLGSSIAGERNTDSATASYLSVKDEWTYTVVDLTANSTTVSAAPAMIGNVWINTALSAHTCPIKDNATTLFTLPASAPATTTEATAFTFMRGTRFETSLIVDPDDAMTTGSIVVQWRAL